MNDPATEELTVAEEYEQAKRGARKAYYTAAGLIIIFSSLNVFYIIFAGKSFVETRTPEIVTHFGGYMATLANRHGSRVSKASANVLPVLADEIINSAKQELPKIEKTLQIQGTELRQHIEERGMKIGDISGRLVTSMEQQVFSEIEKAIDRKLTDQERKEFTLAFATRLNQKLLASIDGPFQDHKEISKELEKEIRRLVVLEPDLNRKVDPIEAVGILLELGGVKLQLARAENQ